MPYRWSNRALADLSEEEGRVGMLVAMDVVASKEGRLWGGVALLEEEVQGGEGVPK